jgi:hypothetical protein
MVWRRAEIPVTTDVCNARLQAIPKTGTSLFAGC